MESGKLKKVEYFIDVFTKINFYNGFRKFFLAGQKNIDKNKFLALVKTMKRIFVIFQRCFFQTKNA